MNSELPAHEQSDETTEDQKNLPTRDDNESSVLDDQDTSEDNNPSHPAAWVVAILAALTVAVAAPILSHHAGIKSPFGNSYLPTLPLILLAGFAMLWNPVVKRLGPLSIFVLKGRSLLLVAIFTYLVAGVAMTGLAGSWAGSLVTADTFQKSNNLNPALTGRPDETRNVYGMFVDQETTDSDYLGSPLLGPDGQPLLSEQNWSLPSAAESRATNNEAAESLLAGIQNPNSQSLSSFFEPLPNGKGGAVSPFGLAESALSNSFPIIIFGVLLMLGVVAITAKQWTHNERLQHPLVQIPVALTEGSMLRNKAFWITVGTVVLFWFYQLGSQYEWHVLPQIKTNQMIHLGEFYKLFGMDSAGGWPKQIMTNYWGAISIYPFAIGVAFLLALDVGFSVWGGFFFGVMAVGWLYALGVDVNFDTHGRLAGGGATMALALVILYLGRLHYWRLLRAAFFAGPNADDPLGVWGIRVYLLGAVGTIAVLYVYFGTFWPSVLTVLMITSFLLVIGRVIAESGLACFQAAHTLSAVTLGLGLPIMLPINGMMAMLWMSSVMVEDTRNNLTGYAVQGAAMAERAKHPPRIIFTVATIVVLAAALIAVTVHLMSLWTGDGAGLKGTGFSMDQVVRQVQNPSPSGLLGMSLEQGSILVGALMVFAVVTLRRFWYACPLHPIGLVIATSFPIFLVWGSLMIGWLAKIIVLRYGGSQLYKKLKPVAIGFILGDVLGFGMQMFFQLVLGTEAWRTWP